MRVKRAVLRFFAFSIAFFAFLLVVIKPIPQIPIYTSMGDQNGAKNGQKSVPTVKKRLNSSKRFEPVRNRFFWSVRASVREPNRFGTGFSPNTPNRFGTAGFYRFGTGSAIHRFGTEPVSVWNRFGLCCKNPTNPSRNPAKRTQPLDNF